MFNLHLQTTSNDFNRFFLLPISKFIMSCSFISETQQGKVYCWPYFHWTEFEKQALCYGKNLCCRVLFISGRVGCEADYSWKCPLTAAIHICVVVIHCQQSDDNLTDVNDTYPWKPELCHCVNCLTAFLSY